MKSLLLTAVLGVTLLAPAMARADASEQGCESSDGKAKGCTKDPTAMPEPGIAILAGSGLLALGGFVLLRRKQQSN
jgi:LPXTG-motif cell wall-anchored protein